MIDKIKILLKYMILLLIGGTIYYCIELLWRGYSHWTMAVLGAVCFVIIGGLNEFYTWEMPFWKQCVIGSIVITVLEFIFGCILNIWLNMNIWNYSNLPMNIMGQICLPFSLIWIVLSGIAIIVDDWLRYWLFKEEKPKYRII